MPAVGIVVTLLGLVGLDSENFSKKVSEFSKKKGRVGKKEGCFKKGDITNKHYLTFSKDIFLSVCGVCFAHLYHFYQYSLFFMGRT